MRLSFMSWVCPTWELQRIVDFVRTSAYDGVEFRVGVEHGHGLSADSSSAERRAAVERLEEAGVAVPAVATGQELAQHDELARADEIDAAKANVRLASDLGADYLRLFAGGDHEEMTDSIATATAAALDEVGSFAAEHDVMPLLETMHDIVQSPEDAYAVLEKVESDNVGILWNRAAISLGAFEAIRSDVRHVHMHDDVLEPPFDDVQNLVSVCSSGGYEGYFSLEIIRGEDLPEEQLRETGQRLRSYIEEAEGSG